MGLDLSKLTPAPWEPYRYMQPAATNDYALLGPDGQTYCKSKTDMQFAALARNAFDVMMRRGVDWIFLQPSSDGRIIADCPDHGWIPGKWDDPYTAWVEADRWYREHIEKTNA